MLVIRLVALRWDGSKLHDLCSPESKLSLEAHPRLELVVGFVQPKFLVSLYSSRSGGGSLRILPFGNIIGYPTGTYTGVFNDG